MTDKIVGTILEYAKELVKQNVVGSGDCISVRAGEYLYASDKEVAFADLTEASIKKIKLTEAEGEYALHAAIYEQKEDVLAVCHCHPAWVTPISDVNGKIPTVADDMAQIVGINCKTCKNEQKIIVKNLKKRNSILVKGDGCVTTGRTLNEAYTCALVLDKAAHCYVGAAAIGKNALINCFEATLMNVVYKMKYSKKNQQNLQSEEGNGNVG